MPAVTRIGDADVTHCTGMTRAVGSPNVFANNIPVSRQGDNNTTHLLPGVPCPPHAAPIATGSTTVKTNNVGTGRVGDAISGISRLNSILLCLFASSVIILLNTLSGTNNETNEIWSSILVLIPLVINFIIYSLVDYQEEQLTTGFDSRSKNRNESLLVVKDWEQHLLSLSRTYKNNDVLISEIERIKNIVNYSSFFRSTESKDLLTKIKSSSNTNELLDLFSEVK